MTSFIFVVFAAVLVPAPRTYMELPGECRLTGDGLGFASIRDVTDAKLPAEGYRIDIATNGIVVTSADAAGAFYARQTLRQLARPAGANTFFGCARIEDAPAYRWRGVHFDDCRHFFGKATLKRTLDLMARHKMNVLHWHLTEDQGWRLDIPGYPDLVRYGAVRPASPVHRAKKWRDGGKGDWVFETDGTRYGPFFYTEADVKEILAYAAERHITVVPEIELPGHVYAALAAYPEFACRPENLAHRHPRLWWGIERDVLCLGNDRAIRFMEDVLDYVCRLFPSPYVHIGGDECPSVRWKDCPKCQARIRAEKLKDEKDLQPWVTRHFVRFLEARGKRAVGWDEYLNGDVPRSCIGMYWRARKASGAGHDRITGAEAVERGHDMVMAPSPETYFYFGQGLEDDPLEYGGNLQLPLSKVYAFDPCRGVSAGARKHVLGGQCCNWSEYTWNENDLEWKMWPRACAMAETLWLGEAKPGYGDFYDRMRIHRRRLVRDGVHAAPLPPSVTDGWRLVRGDEFDGPGLDTTMWNRCVRGPSDWNRHMSDRPELVEVRDGLLVLKGVRTPADWNDERPFVTGGISSDGKFSFRYGKVEIRARFHDQKGAWPAFWMMPERACPQTWKMGCPPAGDLKWPDCGEIDIVERLNADPFVYQTVHSKWTKTFGQTENPPSSSGKRPLIEPDRDGFCVYGLEWDAREIRWTVNGVVTHRYGKFSESPDCWPWDKPFYLILDMQLGGHWVGEVDVSTLPVTCEIDWVRVYAPETSE